MEGFEGYDLGFRVEGVVLRVSGLCEGLGFGGFKDSALEWLLSGADVGMESGLSVSST